MCHVHFCLPVKYIMYFNRMQSLLNYGLGMSLVITMRMAISLIRHDIVDSENRPQDIDLNEMKEHYDFIIVGGGTAGSVLANRLSEVNWTVLLLEAGGDEPLISDVPLLFPTLQLTNLDWQFKTEPSGRFCLAMNEGRCNWPRGKVLGGSSVLNAMLYVRGNKKDYDRWESLGNRGWKYEDVLPYFKKSEDMRIDEYMDSPYHKTGGYLTVEEFSYKTPISKAFVVAGKEMGYDVTDVNGERQTGFTMSPGTLRNGLRCSTAKAYLRPASKRKNLHISFYTHVEKIIIGPYNKTAQGVVFTKNGEGPYRVSTIHSQINDILFFEYSSLGKQKVKMESTIYIANHLALISQKLSYTDILNL